MLSEYFVLIGFFFAATALFCMAFVLVGIYYGLQQKASGKPFLPAVLRFMRDPDNTYTH